MDDIILTVYETRGQRWVFAWRPSTLCLLLRKLTSYAANPELDFTWRDVWILQKRCAEKLQEARS